ncbi:DUF6090 family protein [Winogradskyella alexanderae]|uniref:Uncharacterized protein n=1 Tax=Winogradskyella alexanderae TaxID=2877123 RepID=A0ABS7XVX3_9FLAO|nr:DUF6090 family protein [Winogradskyella alexanderae]MCA0133554.1 hypothetical protein [Winogradskyella alexanderae]
MIKFFRKIRQNLLIENKTGKYFKYAIGEIVLVVIGILIALQINNWNEQRKENIKEQAILKRLQKEFISNRDQLQDKIDFRNNVIKNCELLLNNFNEPKNGMRNDILNNIASLLPSTYDPIQNDLVSSGNVEILKNEELKQLLVNWSTDVIQLKEVEQMYLRYFEHNISSYLNEAGLQRDMAYAFWNQGPSNLLEKKQINNPIPGVSRLITKTKDELLADPKLEGIVAWSLNLNMFNNEESETLMNRIDFILEVLNSEIE